MGNVCVTFLRFFFFFWRGNCACVLRCLLRLFSLHPFEYFRRLYNKSRRKPVWETNHKNMTISNIVTENVLCPAKAYCVCRPVDGMIAFDNFFYQITLTKQIADTHSFQFTFPFTANPNKTVVGSVNFVCRWWHCTRGCSILAMECELNTSFAFFKLTSFWH